MKTAEEIRNAQLKFRENKPLPEYIIDLFEEYVEKELGKVLFLDYSDPLSYDEYYKGKLTFNKKYKNKYGISFSIYEMGEEYGLHKSYFKNFMHYANYIVAKIRDHGYIVKLYPHNKDEKQTNVDIEILWQDINPLKDPPEV